MNPNPVSFFAERWAGIVRPTASFPGQTILITGANTGLGLEVALQYVSLDEQTEWV